MKKTFKLLTVTLVLTMASQSFAMSSIFSRVSKVGTRLAAQAGTQLTSAATKLSKSATLARLMPSNKLVAKRMLYASGAGIAMATAAHAKNEKGAQKEWTPEQMKEKLDELRVFEEASTDKRVTTHDLLIEGTYVCKDDASKERLKLIKDNTQLLSHCLSREGTYRTADEENRDQESKKRCVDGYFALAKKTYSPEAGNGFRQLTSELIGAGVPPKNKPVEGDKSEVSIEVQSKQDANSKDEIVSFSYRVHGQIYTNRAMQLLYKPEFVWRAEIDPRVFQIRQMLLKSANDDSNKELFKLNFNMPIPLSDTLTITRVKMLAALKAVTPEAKP